MILIWPCSRCGRAAVYGSCPCDENGVHPWDDMVWDTSDLGWFLFILIMGALLFGAFAWSIRQ